MNMVKSVRLSKKGQFVIPKKMREALGVKEGEELLVTLESGKLVLSRPGEYAKKTRGLLKGTWGKDKRAVERYISESAGLFDIQRNRPASLQIPDPNPGCPLDIHCNCRKSRGLYYQ